MAMRRSGSVNALAPPANATARPGGGCSALVEVKLAALAGGALHLGAPAGPVLVPRPLPYDVPAGAPGAAPRPSG
jgi:hypothetical protein